MPPFPLSWWHQSSESRKVSLLRSITLSHFYCESLPKGYMIVALNLYTQKRFNKLLKKIHKAGPQRQGHSYSSVIFSSVSASLGCSRLGALVSLKPLESSEHRVSATLRRGGSLTTDSCLCPPDRPLPALGQNVHQQVARGHNCHLALARTEMQVRQGVPSPGNRAHCRGGWKGELQPARPTSGGDPVLLVGRRMGMKAGTYSQMRPHRQCSVSCHFPPC